MEIVPRLSRTLLCVFRERNAEKFVILAMTVQKYGNTTDEGFAPSFIVLFCGTVEQGARKTQSKRITAIINQTHEYNITKMQKHALS